MPITTTTLELADITAAAATLDKEADAAGSIDHERKRLQAQTLRGVVDALTNEIAAGTAQVETVTTVADVASSLDGTYFQLSDEDGTVSVWIDVGDSGTTIPGGASALDRAIEVTGVVADDSADSVATAVASAIDGDSKFSASAVGSVITVTHATKGDVADGADGDAGFSFAVTTQGADASDALYQTSIREVPEIREETDIHRRIVKEAGF